MHAFPTKLGVPGSSDRTLPWPRHSPHGATCCAYFDRNLTATGCLPRGVQGCPHVSSFAAPFLVDCPGLISDLCATSAPRWDRLESLEAFGRLG
jgi:hypothetical protein